jgi:hypothetical protein
VGFNDNFFHYKMNLQGDVQWQIVSDRGNVELHYSPFTPTADGGVFAVLNVSVSGKGEFEDDRLLRLVRKKGSEAVTKKDLKWTGYETNTIQGAAAKIDADGNIEWIRHIIRVDDGKINGNAATTGTYFDALVADRDGNYWLSGRYLKPLTFDLPDGSTRTLTPHNVEGWNGDANYQRGDMLLVKLNPQGELLWHLETGGTVLYESINSLCYHDGALYLYGNLAATPGDPNSHTSLFGQRLYPTEKTNAFSARLDVSSSEPALQWLTLLQSLPQTNGAGGRIKVTRLRYENGALFLCGSVTGFVEVNGATVLSNDLTTGSDATALRAFVIRQDPKTGSIATALLDPAIGLAAETATVAFRQNRLYVFGYSSGVSWLHVYDEQFEPVASHNLFAASGATAWDALFLDDRFITVNRGRNVLAVNGYITGAPQALVRDDPPAFAAYFLAYRLDGLQHTGIETLPATGKNIVKIVTITGQIVYTGTVNGEKEITLPKGIYIISVNGKTRKIIQ